MLRKLFFSNSLIHCRGLAAQVAAKDKYDIFAGVLIERLPIISKSFNEIEKEVMVNIFLQF